MHSVPFFQHGSFEQQTINSFSAILPINSYKVQCFAKTFFMANLQYTSFLYEIALYKVFSVITPSPRFVKHKNFPFHPINELFSTKQGNEQTN
ncbi:hypothetical protein A7P54_12280 [Acinetobacter sp. Ac_3412]|nr:hypothetical protein [Acinetobacter sp. Ac_3412]